MQQILIAEDNPKDYEFLIGLLEEHHADFSVERAINGKEALQAVLRMENPLLISDIQMPELNGVDMAKSIWAEAPHARIVFWSQHKDEMYVRALAKIVPAETVYGYVLKSSTKENIYTAIKTVLLEDQCWIDPEVRKVQSRARASQSALSDVEYEALIDISIGLTDNMIAQRRYLSKRGAQSRLNTLYAKLGIDQEQYLSAKAGDTFNLRNRAVGVALKRGLINPFELEHEETIFQEWFTTFKRQNPEK